MRHFDFFIDFQEYLRRKNKDEISKQESAIVCQCLDVEFRSFDYDPEVLLIKVFNKFHRKIWRIKKSLT